MNKEKDCRFCEKGSNRFMIIANEKWPYGEQREVIQREGTYINHSRCYVFQEGRHEYLGLNKLVLGPDLKYLSWQLAMMN